MSTNVINTKPQASQTSALSPTKVQSTRPEKHLPESVTNRISDFFSDRRDLILTGHQVCTRWQELFSNVLNLHASKITDDELIEIIYKNRKHLTYIDISKCKNITDKSIKYIAKLQNLKHLNLSECPNITNEGLKHLSNLQNLTELNLNFCSQITDAGIKNLANLHNLTKLFLHECDGLTDAAAKDLSLLQNLEHLDLSQYSDKCFFTDAGMKDLSKLNKLTNLNLIGCNTLSDAAIKDLSKLNNLTELDLGWCAEITDAGVKDLSNLQHLRSLSLYCCCKITDAGVKDISKLRNLTTLNLMGCTLLTNAGVKDLSQLKKLTTLYLMGCTSLTEECIENFITLHLTKFNLTSKQGRPIYAMNSQRWNSLLSFINERADLQKFINKKSIKFRIFCALQYTSTEPEMSCNPILSIFRIDVNPLFLLTKKEIDAFLLQHSEHQEKIKIFLVQKKPELLDLAARDLIDWFNKIISTHSISQTKATRRLAKKILIMHSLEKLEEVKRFILTHEMGHAHDYTGAPSFGGFVPSELDFIKPDQYGEMRADLTAARELNAHELGITLFEWSNILARPASASAVHPTYANRARAIKLDYEKIRRATSILAIT